MKVLNWTAQTVCTGAGHRQIGCGALLEITMQDIAEDLITTSHQGDLDSEFVKSIRCIKCGAVTSLPKNIQLPPHGDFPTRALFDATHNKSEGGGPG